MEVTFVCTSIFIFFATANGNSCIIAVRNIIVKYINIICLVSIPLTGNLDTYITGLNKVICDNDMSTAINIDTISSSFVVTVSRIIIAGDIAYTVADAFTVSCPVELFINVFFISNEIDTDIIVVMNIVEVDA